MVWVHSSLEYILIVFSLGEKDGHFFHFRYEDDICVACFVGALVQNKAFVERQQKGSLFCWIPIFWVPFPSINTQNRD